MPPVHDGVVVVTLVLTHVTRHLIGLNLHVFPAGHFLFAQLFVQALHGHSPLQPTTALAHLATHAFPYVLPSLPQTGAKIFLQAHGFGVVPVHGHFPLHATSTLLHLA
jgi:hypothetical protein